MRKRVLVLGGFGQLGQSIKAESIAFPTLDLKFISSAEGDVTRKELLKDVFTKYAPDAVINCSAYTAVDRAEEEPESAYLINAHGPEYLAEVCADHGVFLVHISTDFVFPGNVPAPLSEADETHALSVYGASKLEGERFVLGQLKTECLIIRTSWLYSEFGANFLRTMLRLGKERTEIGVVADQVGTPTYARDLASFILICLTASDRPVGIYHYSNEGVASWYDFASAIFDISGDDIQVRPLQTDEFPTTAKRPPYSVLNKAKARDVPGVSIRHWRHALEACMKIAGSSGGKI